MNTISANDLKTKGVAAIQAVLDQQDEADIEAGRFVEESAEAHLARLESMA